MTAQAKTEDRKLTFKERLELYYTLKKEIPLLDGDIVDEKHKLAYAGSYQDSDGREKTLFISVGSLKSLNTLLDRKTSIETELLDLENLVFNIPDSEMRQILTVAYLNGGRERRWDRVAIHFDRDISGESYRKKADRYLEKLAYASIISMKS
jgi:hypothetical protein